MYLVIDSGNTFIKCYFFENEKIIDSACYSHAESALISKKISEYSNITGAIVCDVSEKKEFLFRPNSSQQYIEFTHATPIPLKNAYKTPETLGLDRLAAAVGAEYELPNTNKIIIDAGTAITIDFISENNTYQGGNISLGLESRFKALHSFTGKLPKLEKTETISLTGKNTLEAIQNGVIQGILFEIEGYISSYNTIYSDISVFLTGGDTFFFEKMLKKPIFAQQNLIAIGLHRILKYNVEK